MPDRRARLIDHAGQWALAKADLGNGGPVPALVSRDRILDLSARPEMAGARTVTELLERWEAVAPVLAAVAAAVLNRVQEPVQQAFATTGVRL